MEQTYLIDSDRMALLAWAKLHPEISRVWLYGSMVKGRPKLDSDIDLAVEISGEKLDDRIATYIGTAETLRSTLALSRELDLQFYDPEDGLAESLYVGPALRDHGICIYPPENN